jgi:NADP-dependent 3-hydroxy acid dehydrogenase YdfG
MQPRANEIIGAASGTGLEIAKILITKGATLSIPDIQDAALQSAASQLKELGGPDAKVLAQRVDVTKRSMVDSWI